MSRIHAVVERNLKKAADVNKRRHDNGLKEDIKVGQSVLLRRTAFTGRHKLSGKFHRDPYVKDTCRRRTNLINEEGDVYDIRPTHGGPVKRENKKLLLIDPRADEVPADPPPPPRLLDALQRGRGSMKKFKIAQMKRMRMMSCLFGTSQSVKIGQIRVIMGYLNLPFSYELHGIVWTAFCKDEGEKWNKNEVNNFL